MTKVIIQAYPTLGTGIEDLEQRRPIGRDRAAFDEILTGLGELAVTADELGYWGLSHTEHHFHSEGVELSPDPGLYNLYLGAKTSRLRHGQLGFVLPTHDPIRLAERITMIDHMLEGRLFVGMVRGYQSRWVSVLGQKMRGEIASISDADADADAANWELFREHYRVMKLAWTQDLLRYQGSSYSVPAPFEAPPSWPPAEFTARYGSAGEIGPDGELRGVSVVPRPLQDPHPPLFQGQTSSRRTLAWCAREGVVPVIQYAPVEWAYQYAQYYRAYAHKAGRELASGEQLGLLRIFHIADRKEDAYLASERYDTLVWGQWYRHFGFLELFRAPGEEGPVPAPGESVAQRLRSAGLVMAGTADDVKRELEKTFALLPAEYLIWHLAFGPMPVDYATDQLERFVKIMDDLGLGVGE